MTQQAPILPLLLQLADTALILSQRQSAWCGHGPILEQDIAITNISLDLLGQARNLYTYAATILNNGSTEDSLAYLRTQREYQNLCLVELPNGDWAHTILKLYLYSEYSMLYLTALTISKDAQLAAIATKCIKETTYHLRWSKEWVLRLGDGTTESHNKMIDAIDAVWPTVPELFTMEPYEQHLLLSGVGVNNAALEQYWLSNVLHTLEQATLPTHYTIYKGWRGLQGKQGIHTEHLGAILAEMQHLQRTYPNCTW